MPNQEQGSRPVPDPTVLTTEALHREINNLREVLETRLAGMEEMTEGRFSGIRDRFGLVEQQRVEQKADSKSAVDAALDAQKEAVAKSEKGTHEQLGQLSQTFEQAAAGLRRDLDGLKERVVALESQKVGAQEQTNRQDISFGQILASIGLVVAIISVAAVIAVG